MCCGEDLSSSSFFWRVSRITNPTESQSDKQEVEPQSPSHQTHGYPYVPVLYSWTTANNLLSVPSFVYHTHLPFLLVCFLIHNRTNAQVIYWGREGTSGWTWMEPVFGLLFLVCCLAVFFCEVWVALSLSLSLFFFSPRESDHLPEVTTVYWLPSNIFGKKKIVLPPPPSLCLLLSFSFVTAQRVEGGQLPLKTHSPTCAQVIERGPPRWKHSFSEGSKSSTWRKHQRQTTRTLRKSGIWSTEIHENSLFFATKKHGRHLVQVINGIYCSLGFLVRWTLG